jgi:hypothetical protein
MITSIFKKSTVINYSLILILLLSFFFVYQFANDFLPNTVFKTLEIVGILLLLFASFFLVNFIVKKNRLTKDSSYSLLFFFLLLLFFPSVLNNFKLVIANFFILLAMRRLISLQTLKASKEKIFDASFWIFIATLFHFWSILFINLVFISIIFHVSRDYRNWLVPFVAAFAVIVLFVFFAFLFDKLLINNFFSTTVYSLKMDYFKNIYQNISFSIFAVISLFFIFTAITTLTSKPLNLQSAYKQVIISFVIGIFVFILSANKSNEVMLFTFFPLSVMATNNIEYNQVKIRNEVVLAIFILLSFYCFFTQL